LAKIDKQAYQERLDRITELFAGMVQKADALSRERCPYRDRHDRCTALFSCRNQVRAEAEGEKQAASCGHDGRFDYRLAWESKPESKERAKRRLQRIKSEARRRRAEKAARQGPE
jgi:hypothetical protein